MRSHRSSNNNIDNNRLQTNKNDHNQKKSVFDRLGHQVDSKRRQSSKSQGRIMTPSRTNQPPGHVLVDDDRTRNQFMVRNNVPHNQHLSPIDRRHQSHQMDRQRQLHPMAVPAIGPGPPPGAAQQQGSGPQFSHYGEIDLPSPRHGQFFAPQHDGYGPNQPPTLHHHQQPPGPMGQPDMNFYNQHHRAGPNNNNLNPGMQFRNRRMDFNGPPGPPPHMEMNMMLGMPDEMFMPGPRGSMEMHPAGLPTGIPHDMMPPNNGDRVNFMGHPQHGNPMMMPRWDHPDMMAMHHSLDQFGRPMMDHQSPSMPRPIADGHIIMNEQQQLSNMMGQPEAHSGRYTKWRERRDVITNLDRETTQSSFRTDSLKSSLHHPAPGMGQQKSMNMSQADNRVPGDRSSGSKQSYASDRQQHQQRSSRANRRARRKKQIMPKKDEHPPSHSQSQQQVDLSDGEIVEGDSVSEEDEEHQNLDNDNESEKQLNDKQQQQQNHARQLGGKSSVGNSLEHSIDQARPAKRARQSEDSSCTKDEDLDYETISDCEDLDDFMEYGTKKSAGSSKNCGSKKSDPDRELLVALGLDWGSLVEMAKQNKNTARYKVNAERSALSRFKLSEYLPKLGICKDLINPEISLMVDRICRT